MAAAIPPGTDLSKIPLAPNPNGDLPNFMNPPSQAATALAVGLPLAIIGTFVVAFRLITNYRHVRKLCLDDCEYWVRRHALVRRLIQVFLRPVPFRTAFDDSLLWPGS